MSQNSKPVDSGHLPEEDAPIMMWPRVSAGKNNNCGEKNLSLA